MAQRWDWWFVFAPGRRRDIPPSTRFRQTPRAGCSGGWFVGQPTGGGDLRSLRFARPCPRLNPPRTSGSRTRLLRGLKPFFCEIRVIGGYSAFTVVNAGLSNALRSCQRQGGTHATLSRPMRRLKFFFA
jgi:hypothetical protein